MGVGVVPVLVPDRSSVGVVVVGAPLWSVGGDLVRATAAAPDHVTAAARATIAKGGKNRAVQVRDAIYLGFRTNGLRAIYNSRGGFEMRFSQDLNAIS